MPPTKEDLTDHVRFLGMLSIALGVVATLAWLILLMLGGFLWFPAGSPFYGRLAYGALAVTGALFVVGVWGVVAGAGLLARQRWARPATLPLAALNLVNVPFGTLYGAYGLWVLTRDGVEAVLDAPLPWARD